LLASLCIGGALGLLAGLVIGYYRGLSAVFYPLALVAFSVPLNVFAPQFVATLGFGIGSKIAFGATVCFWVVFFQMVSSVRNADQSRAAAVRQMGGRGSEVFLYVLVPMGVRYLVTGLRAASPYTLEVIVLAEIWGSTAGLGRMVTVSVRNVDVAATFVAIVLLATLGVLMSLGIDRLDRAAARKLEGVQ
jgi:NitT/TauT family transport system permease protein